LEGDGRAFQGLVGEAMSYVTVFEITHESIPLWFPFSFLIFGLFGAVFFLPTRDLVFITKVVRYFMLLFAGLWVVFAAYYFLARRHTIQVPTTRSGIYMHFMFEEIRVRARTSYT
jgi:hypothetical protein